MENLSFGQIVSLNMKSKSSFKLSFEQKKELLNERIEIINNSINQIQNNFFKIGKALAEIKEFRLYKADPLYNKWKDYVQNRIYPKLHQSTITDYIGIVKMQLENNDFIGVDELVILGVKKAKLLKSKYNLIKSIKNEETRNSLLKDFKKVYLESFDELKTVPYTVYEKKLDTLYKKDIKSNSNEVIKNNFKIKFNKVKNTLIVRCDNKDKIENMFNKILTLIEQNNI